ncbi:MAG TPA: isochorismatase family protein [Holophagaceae bacterium]|nr:isochorismatase family protein [Holophagaceae bacterium]
MALLESDRSILVVIDLQGKLVHQVHRSEAVLETTKRLLAFADLFQVPVVLTEQYPKGLGPTEPGIRAAFDALTTPTFCLEKTAFGCAGEPAFAELLALARPGLPPERRQVVVAGIETHVCVMQTVLALLAGKHEVQVCWDAVSGRGEDYRRHGLERMAQAGAVITNHESVAFEWARHKDHPGFKAVSTILKAGQPWS